ncbi:arsenic resistance protein [Paenibacillus chitinolyticus]|uniref:Arsenic resistance protein n=1 Tax=Paenibacillus chitinolyticus TaxID=79263 RepID=A0A410WYW6_9BACL|nr:bile acid:sodium symporter [Paenibacillus chitinolyticus]MCY9590647.1 bile acid:sodium symporter [Paenibacillus chitinolyticus]MCY9596357.1 bile acid:sodium symporter [Paenibacillus chitinolyticus]QAV19381.1 arsenic resistance protein [Paenibacillus chitinolyticus]
MISREQLEKNQVWLYAFVLIIAAGFGLLWPDSSENLDRMISFVLAILMYGMFAQIPFFRLKEALANRKFIYALLITNYLVVPVLVWGLTRFLPNDPAILLGVLLVLLTPCIDYVIVFTHLGRGNEKLILVSTPILFVTQMLLLPVYLWLFMGKTAAEIVSVGPFLEAFLGLIVVPLVLALLTQWWSRRQPLGERFLDATAWLPVPFMALTLFVVVASQISKLYTSFDSIIQVIPVYAAYMAIIPIIARIVSRIFRLDTGAGRALIFSAGTRNSLVVLPFALALPEPLNGVASAVIVTQTIVELIGELLYIRLVPKVLLRDTEVPN